MSNAVTDAAAEPTEATFLAVIALDGKIREVEETIEGDRQLLSVIASYAEPAALLLVAGDIAKNVADLALLRRTLTAIAN